MMINRKNKAVPSRNSFRGTYNRLNESGELDHLYEAEGEGEEGPKTMTDEKLKIESLKIAINISKLMSDVQVDDVVQIAQTVADFIRNRDIQEQQQTQDGGDFGEDESDEDDVTDEI